MKNINPLQKKILLGLMVLVLSFLVILSITGFISKVKKNETAIADQTLLTAANNGVTLIQSIFDDYMLNMENIAVLYEKNQNFTGAESLATLQTIATNNGFDRLAVDYPDGTSYTSDGYVFDVSSFGYLDKIKRGESFITNVLPAIADGKNVVSFIAPLHDDSGTPIAGLRLTISTKVMTDIIDFTLFNGEGYYHLIDENGYYVAAGESQNALLMEANFFDAISVMDYDEGYSVADIEKAFTQGESGFVRYSAEGNKRYAYCQPAGINNWVLMTIVPQEITTQSAQQNISFAVVMTSQLAVILCILFAYIYLVQRKSRKTAVLNEKCFRALAKQTNKVIFEWNLVSGNIVAMNNFKALFDRDMVTKNSAKQALSQEMVHPEDKEEFQRVFATILSGKSFENIRFRVMHKNGDYRWCQMAGIVVFDHKKRPYKAIGSLEDIQDQITNEVQMKHKSEIDQLTGVYNRSATEQRIQQFLNNNAGSCGLMIIDIDNFKNVNDSLGHQIGDLVLVEFAEVLKSFANDHTVVGRIGGDEFFLFFAHCEDGAFVTQIAEKICKEFTKTYRKEWTECDVSVSIGISFYPHDGEDFETLYKRADVALYRRKAVGKNGYTVYNTSLGNEVSVRTEIDEPEVE